MYKLFIVLVVLFQTPLSFSSDGCLGAFAPKPAGNLKEYNGMKGYGDFLVTLDIARQTINGANWRALLIQGYSGMDGLARFADWQFEGDMERAFEAVSSMYFTKEEMRKKLNWHRFVGSTGEYHRLKDVDYSRVLQMDIETQSGAVVSIFAP